MIKDILEIYACVLENVFYWKLLWLFGRAILVKCWFLCCFLPSLKHQLRLETL